MNLQHLVRNSKKIRIRQDLFSLAVLSYNSIIDIVTSYYDLMAPILSFVIFFRKKYLLIKKYKFIMIYGS